MKVLIVDGSKTWRMIVKRTLRQAGFSGLDVAEAANGVEAVQEIESAAPDLVLSDWNMPEMSGIELLEKLRETGNTINFGFVTCEGTAAMRVKASSAGALFLISKPFTPEAFQGALKPVIS